MKNYYETELKFGYQFAKKDGTFSVPFLYRLMQDCASLHLKEYYDSLEYLKSIGRAYLLTKADMVLFKKASAYSDLTVSTWERSSGIAKIYRNYEIRDKDGLIAQASGTFAYVDLDTKRPLRVSEIAKRAEQCEKDVAAEHNFKIENFDGLSLVSSQTVVKDDTDFYGHMNNARYIDTVCGALPEELEITRLKIDFKSECKIGDVIGLYVGSDGDDHYVTGKKQDGQISFAAKVSAEKPCGERKAEE